MGRTDKYVIPIYDKISKHTDKKSVAGMFGFVKGDKVARIWKKKECYDLRLANWDLNEADWGINARYKTIVCLRTSGFAKDPSRLLRHFHDLLEDEGTLMIDWSLGSEHYPRDSAGHTFGWHFRGSRCHGMYNGQKCYLYSSCLTDECVHSTAFNSLCKRAKKDKHYKNVINWQDQITSEFGASQILGSKDIKKLFNVVTETNWTPLDKNGRFQLYTIQVLRKHG